ncbi:MAG TPA: aldo/keto reductase [Solirubrobacterales bacterium]|nr:aldo/keto reductase [Solirubrobacterales bacterium]
MSENSPELGRTAIGTWSGGRFLHFGEAICEDRLVSLLTPGDGIDTLVTADAYGTGEADLVLGRAIASTSRDEYRLVGSIGHDFYNAERDGPRGFPRFTSPALRGPGEYADYLRMATERQLERLGVDHLDLLLLHNPDRIGYASEEVWAGMAALRDEGLAAGIGIAPGPANGFTLDLLDCFERFGDQIDWAMLILNPFEPWPGSYVLDAAAERRIKVLTRVVDYGGLFWDILRPGAELGKTDHRGYRPAGWIEAGTKKLDRIRPIAERHELTMMQLACQWNLAHPAVECVAPTLIQEIGPRARPIEDLRTELAALPAEDRLTSDEVKEIAAIGDNHGSMALKGASPVFEGEEKPDAWPMTPELEELAKRRGIDPAVDLVKN